MQDKTELLDKQKYLTTKLCDLYSNSSIRFLMLKEEVARTWYERAKVFLNLGWEIQAIYDCDCALKFAPSEQLLKEVLKLKIEAEISTQRYGKAKEQVVNLQKLGDHSEDYRLEMLSGPSDLAKSLNSSESKVHKIGVGTINENYNYTDHGIVKIGTPIWEPNRRAYVKELNSKYFSNTTTELRWDQVKGLGVYAIQPIKKGTNVLPKDEVFTAMRDSSFCFHCCKKRMKREQLCKCGVFFCNDECRLKAEEYHKVLCNKDQEAFKMLLTGVKSGQNASSLFYVIIAKILATAKARKISWKEVPVVKYLLSTDWRHCPETACDLDILMNNYTWLSNP